MNKAMTTQSRRKTKTSIDDARMSALVVMLFLVALATGLFFAGYYTWRSQETREFGQVLIFFACFALSAAVLVVTEIMPSAPLRAAVTLPRVRPRRPATAVFVFNPGWVEQEIQAGVKELPRTQVVTVEPVEHEIKPPPWEVTSSSLVGVNNALALAKLRMDLERELRRLEYTLNTTGARRELRATSLRFLAERLIDKKMIPTQWYTPIRTISHVANQAIHGMSVPDDEQTRGVVEVGESLLDILRTLQPKDNFEL